MFSIPSSRHCLCLASAGLLSFAVAHTAQANLLTNGDFSLGTDRPAPEAPGNGQLADGWTQLITAGWNNREENANGITPTDLHIALGNAGPTDNSLYQEVAATAGDTYTCLLYTSPSPRDQRGSRMPSSA